MESITFEIPKAIDVTVKVVDQDGKIAPDSVVTFSKQTNLVVRRSANGASSSPENKSTTSTSGSDGIVKFEDFYNDSFLLEQAIQANKDKSKKRMFMNDAFPVVIAGFSVEGFQQGQVAVPLPTPDGQMINVELKLVEGVRRDWSVCRSKWQSYWRTRNHGEKSNQDIPKSWSTMVDGAQEKMAGSRCRGCPAMAHSIGSSIENGSVGCQTKTVSTKAD